MRPAGLTATGVSPKCSNAPDSSPGALTICSRGTDSGATSRSSERANTLFHSISAPARVGPTARVPWACSASTTPAASGSSALTIAMSISRARAKAATAAASQTSPSWCPPPDAAACSTIVGFSWPTNACSSLCWAMRVASALSRPPWPTIRVRTWRSLCSRFGFLAGAAHVVALQAPVLFPFALFLFAQFAAFALFLALFAFPLVLGHGASVFGFVLGLFAFAGVLLDGAFARLQPVFPFAGLACFHAAGPFCGPRLFALRFARLRRLGAGAFAASFGLAFTVAGPC